MSKVSITGASMRKSVQKVIYWFMKNFYISRNKYMYGDDKCVNCDINLSNIHINTEKAIN